MTHHAWRVASHEHPVTCAPCMGSHDTQCEGSHDTPHKGSHDTPHKGSHDTPCNGSHDTHMQGLYVLHHVGNPCSEHMSILQGLHEHHIGQ